jgi:hypothetical protein
MSRIIIPAQTAAITSDSVNLEEFKPPFTLHASSLSSGESVGIQISLDNTTWQNYKFGGTDFELTFDTPSRLMQGPARIRFVKGVTTNPVAVGFFGKEHA